MKALSWGTTSVALLAVSVVHPEEVSSPEAVVAEGFPEAVSEQGNGTFSIFMIL